MKRRMMHLMFGWAPESMGGPPTPKKGLLNERAQIAVLVTVGILAVIGIINKLDSSTLIIFVHK